MADFFKKMMHAPRGNEARMQSSTLRKRGIHVPSKLVHPDEKFKGPTKRARTGTAGVIEEQWRKKGKEVDPLNPNPDDHQPGQRRGAGAGGGSSGKPYMSPGDVLRHNAAMAKANGRPQSSGPPSAAGRQNASSHPQASYNRQTVQSRPQQSSTQGNRPYFAPQQSTYNPHASAHLMSLNASAYNLVGVNIETQPMTATARKKAKRLQKQRERERLATLQQQQQQQQQWLQQQQLRLQQEQQQQQQQQQQPQTSSTQDLPPGMPPGHTQPAVDVKQARAALLAAAGWDEYLDAASGDPYYHNASTGQTVWDCPVDLSSLDAQPTNSAAPVAPVAPVVPTVVTAAPSPSLPALVLPDSWRPLKKTTLQPGDGKTWPNPGDTVSVHYTGWLRQNDGSSGQKFDSSHDRAQPLQFQVGTQSVIMGWDQGVMNMTLGEVARLDIAAEYAYGADGMGNKIPSNADLVFEVQLVEIEPDEDEDDGEWEDAPPVEPTELNPQQQQQQQPVATTDSAVTDREAALRERVEAAKLAEKAKADAAASTAAVVAQAAKAKAARLSRTSESTLTDETTPELSATAQAVQAAKAAMASPLPDMPFQPRIADDAEFNTIIDEYIRQQTDERGAGPPPEYRQQIMDIYEGNDKEAQIDMRANMLNMVKEGEAAQHAKDKRRWEKHQVYLRQKAYELAVWEHEQAQLKAKTEAATSNDTSTNEETLGPILGPQLGPSRPPAAGATSPAVAPKRIAPLKAGAKFREGETVFYTKKNCSAMVLKVHTEDSSGVYYTIRASGSQPGSPGAEIQTIESYLQVHNPRTQAIATHSSVTSEISAAPPVGPLPSVNAAPAVDADTSIAIPPIASLGTTSALGDLDYGSSSDEED